MSHITSLSHCATSTSRSGLHLNGPYERRPNILLPAFYSIEACALLLIAIHLRPLHFSFLLYTPSLSLLRLLAVVLLLRLERRVQAEGEHHHQDLEEAEEEGDAGDPAGLDLQHEGDLLGAAVGPLVALDRVTACVWSRDVPLRVVAGAVPAAAAHVLLERETGVSTGDYGGRTWYTAWF